MRDRDDVDDIVLDPVDDTEGKTAEDKASRAAPVARPGVGGLTDPDERGVHFGDEGCSGGRAALGVPALARSDLGFSLGEEPYVARGHAGS